MNERDRFNAVMNYKPHDRTPVLYFGTWTETKARWKEEGLSGMEGYRGSGGPQLEFMDTDWETSFNGAGDIWSNQGLLNPYPIATEPAKVIERTEDYRVVRKGTGGIVKESLRGSSIHQTLRPDLEPTREDWARFKKFLDPDAPTRLSPSFEERGKALRERRHVSCFLGGSLFGWMFNWMGLEGVSLLPYDDPALYEEIISYMADYFMSVNSKVIEAGDFDFAYFFEDCCFNSGPMISPEIFRRFYLKHYVRMIEFYKSKGVGLALIDSDGKVDDLIPCWLDAGFDILFPVEVGVWKSDPLKFRREHGKKLRMLGGVDKHVIAKGPASVRRELERLKPLVEEGGYIPIPDHRIPPDVSLEQMKSYVEIFNETFNGNVLEAKLDFAESSK